MPSLTPDMPQGIMDLTDLSTRSTTWHISHTLFSSKIETTTHIIQQYNFILHFVFQLQFQPQNSSAFLFCLALQNALSSYGTSILVGGETLSFHTWVSSP